MNYQHKINNLLKFFWKIFLKLKIHFSPIGDTTNPQMTKSDKNYNIIKSSLDPNIRSFGNLPDTLAQIVWACLPSVLGGATACGGVFGLLDRLNRLAAHGDPLKERIVSQDVV